jgi:hypothetical protein
MSIGLFIGYRDPRKEDRLIPIASDEVFHTYWKPICAELGLRWVPRFQKGWMLSIQDLPHILEELTRLRRYLACGETHAEISHHMLARISVVVRELNEVHNSVDADAFVGSPWQAQRRAAAFQRSPVSCTAFTERRVIQRPPAVERRRPIVLEEVLLKPPTPPEAALTSPQPMEPQPEGALDYHRLQELAKIVHDLKVSLKQNFGTSRPSRDDSVPHAWRTAIEEL